MEENQTAVPPAGRLVTGPTRVKSFPKDFRSRRRPTLYNVRDRPLHVSLASTQGLNACRSSLYMTHVVVRTIATAKQPCDT
jgi:hypothetical protein